MRGGVGWCSAKHGRMKGLGHKGFCPFMMLMVMGDR